MLGIIVSAALAGLGTFFAIQKFAQPVQRGTDAQGLPVFGLPDAQVLSATAPNGTKVTFNSLRQEAPQTVQAGQRKPTTQELAKMLSFGMNVPEGDTGQASAAQQAFMASMPNVNWNAPTDADVQAALALIASQQG